MWRESVAELLELGGEFEVHTGWLAVDSFTVFGEGVGSVELPDYMIETIIDDARIGNCAKITIKENALEINEDRLPTSELVSSEYKYWHKKTSELLHHGREFDVVFNFDGKFFVSCSDGSLVEIYECMIESFLLTTDAE